MFSSSVINIAAPGSPNSTVYHQYQHLTTSSYSDIFSHHNSSVCGSLLHHNTNCVPGMVAQDGNDHVMNESTITFITPFGNTSSVDMPRSGSRVTKKEPDKRSKIRTAQGLRDRRVRLSIGIARKFFDLQDLLGFDKPSRTVEWLLTKSKKAITDLSAASSSSISCEAAGTEYGCKSLSSSVSTATCDTNQIQQVSCNNSLKTTKQKVALLARELREKARARARARTLAKLCTSKLDHQHFRLLNNPGFRNDGDLLKASDAERKNEKKKREEIPKKKQQLQLHCRYCPNLNLSLDWNINSVIDPQPSSATTHSLNLSRDVEIHSRSSWDQLPNIYKTL